jgi:aspartyl-tRNA(Asn)/glutamyl-tRNA(Gln) amidotransferase subunit B
MLGYQPVIGLEVHAQLLTETKLFCGCSARFGGEPNERTCPVCLGMPGVLPVLNEKAIAHAIRFGLAIHADPEGLSVFSRKNYFYPDLPKGYQITQYEYPVVGEGWIEIEDSAGRPRRIRVRRAHLEEDAGQSVHDGMAQSRAKSYVNLNRAGVPLLELVSEPDMHSADEAYNYLQALKAIVQYLGICDGNMEEGSLRCDANVSVRPLGETTLGTRTEIKNLNSFNNVRRGIQYEVERQVALCQQGEEVEQCTLLWDAEKQVTKVMRTKEDAEDYRYFPEPDLPPLVIAREQVEHIRETLPELPRQKQERLINDYGIPAGDARLMVSDKALAAYYEETAEASGNPKAAANWIMSELLRELKQSDQEIDACPITPEHLAGLIRLIDSGGISGKIGKEVFAEIWRTGQSPERIVEQRGLRQISDSGEISRVVDSVLAGNPDQVADYRAGRTKIFGYFVGQVMKRTGGKANPGLVNQILREKLDLSS